jgi:hypothetical protein
MTEKIIGLLKIERENLTRAIEALGGNAPRKRGRPTKVLSESLVEKLKENSRKFDHLYQTPVVTATPAKRKVRKFTAAEKKATGARMRAWWAAQRKAKAPAKAKAAPKKRKIAPALPGLKRKISAAGRLRMAEAAKARWAAVKAQAKAA